MSAQAAPTGDALRRSEGCGGESACTPDSVRRSRGTAAAAIPLGRRLPAGSSGRPGGVRGRAVLPLRGLAPGGVCRAARVAPGAGALLPHRFTLTCAGPRPATGPAIGGLFSVALSCGSPRLGVTQHRARWSPDVPRTGAPKRPARGRPADSPPLSIVALRRPCPHRNRLTAPVAVTSGTRRACQGRWR
jgi:hypothetical protein